MLEEYRVHFYFRWSKRPNNNGDDYIDIELPGEPPVPGGGGREAVQQLRLPPSKLQQDGQTYVRTKHSPTS